MTQLQTYSCGNLPEIFTDTGAKASIYRRKVVQGNVYLLIILFYMLSPCVLLSIFCFNVKGIGVLTSLPIFIIFPLTYF